MSEYRRLGNVYASPRTVAASGNTTIAELDTKSVDRIAVQISVITQALDAFIISARFDVDGAHQTLFSAAGDYTAPAGVLVGASGDLTAIAAGSSGWFIMDVRAIESVRLEASAALDSAVVTVYAGGA